MYHHSNPCLQCGKQTTGDHHHYCKPRGSRALQFCCQYCTIRFSSKQRLNLHERTHGLDYRFQCPICSKWFTKMSALKTHSYSHSNLRQFKCNVCGKMCKLVGTLKRHMKICHHTKNVENSTDSLNVDQIHNTVTLSITGNESSASQPANAHIAMPVTDEHNYVNYNVSHNIEVQEQQLQ